jgi:hypothetical protein
MLPVTQVTALEAALAEALSLIAADGVSVAGGVVGDGDAPEEHAVTIIAAATAKAPNRRVPFSNMSLLFLLGDFVSTLLSGSGRMVEVRP